MKYLLLLLTLGVASAQSTISISCTPYTGPLTVGSFYSSSCTATGGTSPYSWTTSPSMPAQLSLSATSGTSITVSGTPTFPQSYNFLITATDSLGQTATQIFNGQIGDGSSGPVTSYPSFYPYSLTGIAPITLLMTENSANMLYIGNGTTGDHSATVKAGFFYGDGSNLTNLPSGTGTVTHTVGALTLNQLVFGNGAGDVKVSNLTGDGTTSGTALTLATVDSSPGICGDSTHVCQVTDNGKGLVTSHANVLITGGASNATALQGFGISTNTPSGPEVLQWNVSNSLWTPQNISYQFIKSAGVSVGAQRGTLNFISPLIAADNSGAGQTDVSCPSCGSGSGVPDFNPTVTSGTVTFLAGTYFSSGVRYTFSSSSVAPLTGTASDTIYLYGTSSGTLSAGYGSINTYTFTGLTGVPSISAFPATTTPLYSCAVVSGSVTTCTDYRGIIASTPFGDGLGTTIVNNSGTTTVNRSSKPDVHNGSYTIPGTDCGGMVGETSSSASTLSLAQAGIGGLFVNGCLIDVMVIGSGTSTLSTTTSLIFSSTAPSGASTFAMATGHHGFWSDGTNYWAF